MRDWVKAREFWAIPIVVAVAFGVLVYLAFGMSHTKTVVKTRTVTHTMVKQARFDGSLRSLLSYLRPETAKQVTCSAKAFPPGSACFQLGSSNWFVFFAAPASAATS